MRAWRLDERGRERETGAAWFETPQRLPTMGSKLTLTEPHYAFLAD
jgi:hypothetical protein